MHEHNPIALLLPAILRIDGNADKASLHKLRGEIVDVERRQGRDGADDADSLNC